MQAGAKRNNQKIIYFDKKDLDTLQKVVKHYKMQVEAAQSKAWNDKELSRMQEFVDIVF